MGQSSLDTDTAHLLNAAESANGHVGGHGNTKNKQIGGNVLSSLISSAESKVGKFRCRKRTVSGNYGQQQTAATDSDQHLTAQQTGAASRKGSAKQRCCRMLKRAALAALLVGAVCVTVFVLFVKQRPAADIMRINAQQRRLHNAHAKRMRVPPAGVSADDDYFMYDDGSDENGGGEDPLAFLGDLSPWEAAKDPALRSRSEYAWDAFVERQQLLDIGNVMTACEGEEKMVVGKGTLMSDPVSGGVKTRTFVNFTLTHEITGGELYVKSWYNGNEIFSNKFDFCTAEESVPEGRVIFCPIKPGRKKYIRDMKIPKFLPKGHFKNKVWLLDQDKKLLGCSLTEFSL